MLLSLLGDIDGAHIGTSGETSHTNHNNSGIRSNLREEDDDDDPMNRRRRTNLSEAEYRKDKARRNREAVRRCRKRKQGQMQELEKRADDLERENCNLMSFIEARGLRDDFMLQFGSDTAFTPSSNQSPAPPGTSEDIFSTSDWNAKIEDLRKRRIQLLRTMVECINTGGVKQLLERSNDIWHSDFILVQGFSGEEIRGMEEIQRWWVKNGNLVPDLKITVFNIHPRTSSADKIRSQWTIEGTFNDPGAVLGQIPQNGSIGGELIRSVLPVMRGKKISISGFSHFIFRGVKLEQVVHSYDYSALLAQILGMKSQTVVGEMVNLFQNLDL